MAIAEEVAVVAEDDVDAQLEAALDGVLEELPPDEEAAVEDGGTGVAEDSAAGELGDDADEDDAPTEVTGAEAPVDMTEPQLEADEAAAADGDDDHLPAEVAAAAAAVSKPSQGDSGDGEVQSGFRGAMAQGWAFRMAPKINALLEEWALCHLPHGRRMRMPWWSVTVP